MQRLRLSPSTLLAAALLIAGNADASPAYPHDVATILHLSDDPPCTICHKDLNGGKGTVDKPFGKSLQGFGLQGSTPTSLAAAIQRSRAVGTDSDGDGASDIAELEAGKDPNDPGDGPPMSRDAGNDAAPAVHVTTLIPQPLHGCAVSRRRHRGHAALLACALSAALAAFRRSGARHTSFIRKGTRRS